MVAAKQSYEDSRRKRVEENKKRMEALNLPLLSQALKTSPKPSPVSLSLTLSVFFFFFIIIIFFITKICHFYVFLFHTHLLSLMPTFT